MAVTLLDAAAALYTYLAGVADFAANGFTIYGPPGLPVNWAGGKAVAFWSDGGNAHATLPLTYDRFQLRCYGADHQDARLGYRLLADALNRKGHTRVTVDTKIYVLQYAALSSGPYDLIDPETRWPYVLAYYQVQFYERGVS